MKLSHSEQIIDCLRFWGSLRTSEVLQKLWEHRVSIGANSLTRRLRELADEKINNPPKIIGFEVEGNKEKSWRINSGELF